MRFLRDLIIIVVVVLIFVFFFAGKGVFDDVLPLAEVKGIVMLEAKGSGVHEYEDNSYITRKDETEKFVDHMLDSGYMLYTNQDGFGFEKDDTYYFFESDKFLGNYTTFTPTGVKLNE